MLRIICVTILACGLVGPVLAQGVGVPKELTLTVEPRGKAGPIVRQIAQPGYPGIGTSVKRRGSAKGAAQFSVSK